MADDSAQATITAVDRMTMGDVVISVMRYARMNPDNFTLGPFDTKKVAADGLDVVGDIDNLLKALSVRYGDRISVQRS